MSAHPLLLGHRGARGAKAIPENTIDSFDLALASGCDGFEFDVRRTGDGEAVVCHDARTGSFEIATCSGEQLSLPRLGDVLARYRSTAFLDIELKNVGLEKITLDLLQECTPTRGFVLSSFLPEVLETLHTLDAAAPLGLICETRAQLSRWPELPVGYVIPHYRLVTEDLIALVKAAGKKILVWTVNASVDMRRFSNWNVDGIISDHPKRLVRILAPRSA